MNTKNRIPQILSRFGVTKFFFIISLSSICLTSCDESSVVGLDVQPANDLLNVGYQDSTTIITKTIKEDSLRTDESLITNGNGLIGKYIDPVFGEATASMYTQVRLPSNIISTSFGTSPVCDSVILSLIYEGTFYGKKEKVTQKINVFEVLSTMSISNSYYSSNTLNYNPAGLTASPAGYVFKPRTGSYPSDSVTVLGKKFKPQLRVPLDNNLGQLLLNNQSGGTSGPLSDNAHFQDFFRGLYITTENTTGLASAEGNILHFKMGESLLTVYYHNSNVTNNDSLHYDFSLGSVARFNHFSHNFSTALPNINTQIAASAQSPHDTVYVQSMSGLKTRITFPYLMNWVDFGAKGINKAELVIRVDTSASTYMLDSFAAPAALTVFGIGEDGVSNFVVPDAFEGSNYFGGTYNNTTKEYRFNITRYIQQILDGDRPNTGLFLIASNGAAFGNRVVLSGGSATSTRQMKLNITYTKLH